MYGFETFMRAASSVCVTPSSFMRRRMRRRNAEHTWSTAVMANQDFRHAPAPWSMQPNTSLRRVPRKLWSEWAWSTKQIANIITYWLMKVNLGRKIRSWSIDLLSHCTPLLACIGLYEFADGRFDFAFNIPPCHRNQHLRHWIIFRIVEIRQSAQSKRTLRNRELSFI